MLYGYPGAGKTHFARELSGLIGAAHVHGDRIRGELFEEPRYDQQENDIVKHLMLYMTEEFLGAGMSVVFDASVARLSDRRELRNIARKAKAEPMLIWLQIDSDSAYARLAHRDRRKMDDKYAAPHTRESFQTVIQGMQNPKNEDYMVISGKHTFNTQRGAVLKKLYDLGLIAANTAANNVVKPGLVNLVPGSLRGGRVDNTRRNILIR
jgi:predicted kinase